MSQQFKIDYTQTKPRVEAWSSEYSSLPPKNRSSSLDPSRRNSVSHTDLVATVRIRQTIIHNNSNGQSNSKPKEQRKHSLSNVVGDFPAVGTTRLSVMQMLQQQQQQPAEPRLKIRKSKSRGAVNVFQKQDQKKVQQQPMHAKIQTAIAGYLASLEETLVMSDYNKYRTYILQRAHKLRQYTDEELKLSQDKRREWMQDSPHFNIGLSHLLMTLVKSGSLNIFFEHLNPQVFAKIEKWMIDWIRRRYEEVIAAKRVESQYSKVVAMLETQYSVIQQKKYIPFP